MKMCHDALYDYFSYLTMTERSTVIQDEGINDSWVDLYPQNAQSHQQTNVESVHNGNMERLLREAQMESSRSASRATSNASSNTPSNRGSPKSPPSPIGEQRDIPNIMEGHQAGSDWIWDWSSRPEALPPSDLQTRFRHPPSSRPKRPRLSIRNTKVMQGSIFNMDNLPTLFLTHACTFFLGAATMLIYLRRYCNWAAVKLD